MCRKTVVVALLMALCAPVAWAQQQALSKLPGYFPFEELEILGRDELSVEINLSKPLLRLVAAATRKGEPEFAALIDSLDAVRVRVAPADDVDLERVRTAIGEAAEWLESKSWQVVIRTREDGEETFIYTFHLPPSGGTRDLDGEIAGMAILVIEEAGDVAVINIVGRIDLAQLEKLGEALDIPLLGRGQTTPEDSTKEPATDDHQP